MYKGTNPPSPNTHTPQLWVIHCRHISWCLFYNLVKASFPSLDRLPAFLMFFPHPWASWNIRGKQQCVLKVARTCLFLLTYTVGLVAFPSQRPHDLFPSVTPFGNPAVIKKCIITQCKETSEPHKLCPCKSPLRETGKSLSLCLSFPSFCQSCLSHSVLSSLTCQLVHVCRGFCAHSSDWFLQRPVYSLLTADSRRPWYLHKSNDIPVA